MALDGRQAAIWTALPGIVQSFDPVAMTCVVQPAIQGRVTTKDGVASFVNMPLLLDCPVMFPGGGGATLTFPVSLGDEALVVLANRCIDAWWQQGGIQPPMEARMHDLSDGFAFVGVRSQPRRLTGVSITKVQLRADDGLSYVELDPAGQIAKIRAPNGIVLDGPVHTTSTLQVDGGASFTGATVSHNGVNIGKDHKHSGVTAGGGVSGNPV